MGATRAQRITRSQKGVELDAREAHAECGSHLRHALVQLSLKSHTKSKQHMQHQISTHSKMAHTLPQLLLRALTCYSASDAQVDT